MVCAKGCGTSSPANGMRRASAWVEVWRGITTVSGLCLLLLSAGPALAVATTLAVLSYDPGRSPQATGFTTSIADKHLSIAWLRMPTTVDATTEEVTAVTSASCTIPATNTFGFKTCRFRGSSHLSLAVDRAAGQSQRAWRWRSSHLGSERSGRCRPLRRSNRKPFL